MADAECSGRSADASSVSAGYECLRERVLSGQTDSWRLGHGVLASRGMAAWMAAWPNSTPQSSAPAAATPSVQSLSSTGFPSTAGLSSLPAVEKIVAVLTEMALAHP